MKILRGTPYTVRVPIVVLRRKKKNKTRSKTWKSLRTTSQLLIGSLHNTVNCYVVHDYRIIGNLLNTKFSKVELIKMLIWS